MSYNLWIDDVRDPPTSLDEWVVVRNYQEAVAHMTQHGCPTCIAFDFDLGLGKSGLDIARWMVHRDQDDGGSFIPDALVFSTHSDNPYASNIVDLLGAYIALRKREQKAIA